MSRAPRLTPEDLAYLADHWMDISQTAWAAHFGVSQTCIHNAARRLNLPERFHGWIKGTPRPAPKHPAKLCIPRFTKPSRPTASTWRCGDCGQRHTWEHTCNSLHVPRFGWEVFA